MADGSQSADRFAGQDIGFTANDVAAGYVNAGERCIGDDAREFDLIAVCADIIDITGEQGLTGLDV